MVQARSAMTNISINQSEGGYDYSETLEEFTVGSLDLLSRYIETYCTLDELAELRTSLIEGVKAFLRQNSTTQKEEFKEYLAEITRILNARAETIKTEDPTVLTTRAHARLAAIAASRESAEELADRELLEEVLKNGAVGVIGYLTNNGGCESKMSDEIHDTQGTYKSDITNAIRDSSHAALNLHPQTSFQFGEFADLEAIGFQEVCVQEFDEIDIEVEVPNEKRSIFDKVRGKNKTTLISQKSRIPNGTVTPYMHSQLIKNGREEPAYSIGVLYAAGTGNGRDIRNNVVLYLPQSTALKLWQKIDQDPLFIRRVLVEMFEKKLDTPEMVQLLGKAFSRAPGEKKKMYIVPPHSDTKTMTRPDPQYLREV